MPAWNYGNPEGGLSGWGAPPQLHGGDVSALANAIALMRQRQIEHTQESVGKSIQQMQSERAGNAYLKQLAGAGLISEGELQGTGTAGAENATNLAKLIETQKLRSLQESLYNAHAEEYRALAGKYDAAASGDGLTAAQRLAEERRARTGQAYSALVNKETEAFNRLQQPAVSQPGWHPGAKQSDIDSEWNNYKRDQAERQKAKETLNKAELQRQHPSFLYQGAQDSGAGDEDTTTGPGDTNDQTTLPSGGAVAPPPQASAAGGGDPRARAIQILQSNNSPLTEANIQYVLKQLGP